MTLLLILGGLAVLVGGGVAVVMKANPRRALPAARGAPTVFNLRTGDVVQHLGTDYIVESTVTYREHGLTWHSHLLGGGGAGDRWLAVEEDDRVTIALVEEVEDLPLGAGEPPATLEYRGASFQQREGGEAQASRLMQSTGKEQTVTCRYWDYEGPGDQVLFVEDWPGEREVTWGRKISAAALNLMPGS